VKVLGIITFYSNAENNLRNVDLDWQWQTLEAVEELMESAIALILGGLKQA
jgi:TetR/AcrR family transcriptional regulator